MRHAFAAFMLFTMLGLGAHPALAGCPGDCDRNRDVLVDELLRGVRIALGTAPVDACLAADLDGSATVTIDEIMQALTPALAGCPDPYPRDDSLRLNHLQVLGTHNSYHLQASPPLFELIVAFSEGLARTLEYSHAPLTEQFTAQGVRQIELDVFADPDGGLFASPAGLRLTSGDPDARLPALEAPGFKVLHVQDIDYETTCPTLLDCLREVKAWSDAHPLHAPFAVLIEAKDDVLPDLGFGFVVPIPIGAAELDAIDAEIRAVFPPEQLLVPDDVRGERATLREAIELDGWPTLREARGRVLFLLDNEGAARGAYVAGHPSLRGRVMFTSSRPPADEAAFVKLNDPIGSFDLIRSLVADGYIVRTRADGDTVQARTGDTTQRDAALDSGAQFVSSDYPVPDPRFGTTYMVAMPSGMPARCNPVSAPEPCAPADIEDPEELF